MICAEGGAVELCEETSFENHICLVVPEHLLEEAVVAHGQEWGLEEKHTTHGEGEA